MIIHRHDIVLTSTMRDFEKLKLGDNVVRNNATIIMTGNSANPIRQPWLGVAVDSRTTDWKNCHYRCMYLVQVCPLTLSFHSHSLGK